MKKTYKILINGCDDETEFEMDLTDNEYELLMRVSEKSEEVSTYGCEPTITISSII